MTIKDGDLAARSRRLMQAGLTPYRPMTVEEVPPREATHVVRFDENSYPGLFVAVPEERVTRLRPDVLARMEADDPRVSVEYDWGDMGESWADVRATFRDAEAARRFEARCGPALRELTMTQVEHLEALAKQRGMEVPEAVPEPSTPSTP